MKFAVTGGAGFIGNNIVRELLRNNHTVSIIDNLHTGKKDNLIDVLDQVEFYNTDIRNFEELKMILKNVEGVFHEAALTVVQESFIKKNEYFDVNVKGTENIFKIAKDNNFKVVFASSSSVYGDVTEIPIKEDSARNPINPYGNTKLEDEFLAERYSNDGVEIIGLRYFNVFGIGQTGSYAGVITKFMNQLSKKLPPKIYGDGSQVRDFVFVKDVAEANLSAMQSKAKNGFFNVGTGRSISIEQLARMMIKIYGLSLEPEFTDPLQGDIMKSQAYTSLTKKTLNWEYKTDLHDGLSEIIQNFN
ncbi:NAD-dependent epimerase [Nitrosopumilus sp. b1]|uniref:NAD-dependent epimerase/dehydratase family protein n=1 Tax=Nitrosopumilus sp. b1 TaxID=2109907 RepID=UPI0015F3636F|nr:NAD-dependent epimerase/dehydratase family protein [Nitrosopumilus sp. b1]KAF6242273.1 NAD-dependent epimerase [Nitrosopumilus sp. b1]